MIAPNYNQTCKEAEHYYYDFLLEEDQESIPIEIINHIINCDKCREQINELETMLSAVDKHSSLDLKRNETVVTNMLKLQFAYAGKQVTCSTVRPFLPSQLIPAMLMRIPTPITAHLDNCEQCREDLKILQDLRLGSRQLTTLSQMFADDLLADESTCAEARKSIQDVVAMAFEHTDAKTLRHLSLCPNCREELFKFRQEIVQKGVLQQSKDNTGAKQLYCPSVTAGDIFDYCIPYGIDPKNDGYAKFRKSLTSHIVCCADCLGKIQQLHRKIYEIIDRPESGIVTVLHLDTSAKADTQTESANLYADFPVRVEVSNLEDMPAGEEQTFAEEIKRPVKMKSVSDKLRPFVKIALPIAAVIVIAFSLLYSLPSAKALTIEQIYTAIDKVKNIYIASFAPDKREPIQEICISRSEELYFTKTANEFMLWNVPDNVRKTKLLDTGTIEQTSLNSDALASIRAKIYGPLGIMPFSKSSDIPKDAKWSEITLSDSQSADQNTKLYELSWTEKASNEYMVQRSWRVFTDESTKLPKKVQWFKQLASDDQPVLESTMVIEYPSNEEVLSKADTMSF